MTAAAATPEGMRDRLLQAVDNQGNICNVVVVLEVISSLEKYPITKETLEETRLGKLINDVRKKTKNEDLAKRAKKLLRNWQKLIEPGKSDVLSKRHTDASWSSIGGAHPCISTPAATPPSGKTGPELKNRNDFNNCSLPVENLNKRKHKGGQKEGQFIQAKISKTTLNENIQSSKHLQTNGIGGSAEYFTATHAHQPLDSDKLNKISVNGVKHYPSTLGYGKPPSTSALLKASVLQQHARQEQAATGGQYHPKNPRSYLHSPHTPKREAVVKPTAPPTQNISTVSVQGFYADCSGSADSDSYSRSSELVHNSTPSSCSIASFKDESPSINAGRKKRLKYRPKDYVVNLDGQGVEDGTKPVRLKDRRLTFDPVTGQIKSSFHKESLMEGEVKVDKPEFQWSEQPKQSPVIPPSPFQQTDWKELSRSEIIQSYLSQQSSVLSSSGAHTPGAHFFMTEFLKKEDHRGKDGKNTHVLVLDIPPRELPGVTREVINDDLNRLHTQHWSGVNGCSDTKGNWFDWTECISLDPHGDESRLNILPYVCLD
ncbi:mediator of RNA polymerase II transcription subunit 26 [Pholidichthys leucotaenia]